MTRARNRSAFPAKLPRTVKRAAGKTGIAGIPLNIRASGVSPDDLSKEIINEQLERKLGKFAVHIERIAVRLQDEDDSPGGADAVCRIKAVLNGLPGIEAEERGVQQRDAFSAAALAIERAVRRVLGRIGLVSSKTNVAPAGRRTPEGSLIGRRVGRAAVNLRRAAERPEKLRRDLPVDTAAPGRSATDRKVGKGATATRNTKLSVSRAAYALEDSAQDRPSRKSTRRSSGHVKTDSNLKRRATRATTSPKARATRFKTGGSKRA